MKNSGFTIVETLVAIAILVSVIMGISSAVQIGINSYTYSKDQIAAFYLAQEGVEQIRNIRDTNGLAGANWLSGISAGSGDPCYFGNPCFVDATVDTLVRCDSGIATCPVLRQNPSSGLYGHAESWTPTKFRRYITLSSVNGNEISVLVVVDWSKGDNVREFRVRENLLNWQ